MEALLTTWQQWKNNMFWWTGFAEEYYKTERRAMFGDNITYPEYGIFEFLEHEIHNAQIVTITVGLILLFAILVVGIAILINQRKIKKQLKKLLEEKTEKE